MHGSRIVVRCTKHSARSAVRALERDQLLIGVCEDCLDDLTHMPYPMDVEREFDRLFNIELTRMLKTKLDL